MFSWPRREKIIFLEFRGFGTQIEDGQNTVSTVGFVVGLCLDIFAGFVVGLVLWWLLCGGDWVF